MDLTPTGTQVATANVKGASGTTFLDILRTGLQGAIDVEVARAAGATPDRADVATGNTNTQAAASQAASSSSRPLLDTVKNFSPQQWVLVGVAGLLGFGLWQGWFR